ncbi:NUDIX hydrolase [Bacillus sp. FJAT-49732]|uniref:NUDIX hydrolase n=1 Tax=Lederbergia citrisecunda TaxID=2833583 RepID=A0A942YLM0_9BACI|nr:NUDIX hydrolase [Lederbergia citrisecunda]
MISLKNNGFQFLEFIHAKENDVHKYQPLAGSFAVIKCEGKHLLCYNVWRKQWEVPAGKREGNESPKECAIRELYEETGQLVRDMEFKGLLKVQDTKFGHIKYNPIYFAEVDKLQSFKNNEETSEIKLWDDKEEIGYIDGVDIHIFDYV